MRDEESMRWEWIKGILGLEASLGVHALPHLLYAIIRPHVRNAKFRPTNQVLVIVLLSSIWLEHPHTQPAKVRLRFERDRWLREG